MKRTKNKKFKKYLLLIPILLLATLAITYAYIMPRSNPKDAIQGQTATSNNIDYSPPSKEDKAESERNKNEIVQNMDKPQSSTTTSSSPISISITRASRNIVSVYLEKLNEGTCTLSISQNNQEKITMSAKIITQSEYSTCEGFNIDSGKLENNSFKATVAVVSGNRKGTASQEVN